MKRKRFTEEQIIGVLKEYEAGAKLGDLVARRLEVLEGTSVPVKVHVRGGYERVGSQAASFPVESTVYE